MIKVNNLNKFYNKNKSNQIHVINNISLSFESKGLVCLLGPSGSGKTTLLNAIGGLDKVDSGSIEYNNDVIDKYNPNKWDEVRNKNTAYIFQNYNLLFNLTVYENIMFVLKMTNMPKDEAHDRVMYALTCVGLEKFYKRKVTQLSGGQQQRVAIARALVKSPNVIIADEPTGNLDEKNTTIIMNILKKISEKCLVLLVTHEQRIATFYANRIIKLNDGKIIIDKINESNESFTYSDDNNLYLKEFNKDTIENNNVNINYFFEEEKTNVNLNIVYKDNTLYIQNNSNIKVKYLEDDTEMKMIDTKKPKLNLEEVNEFKYELEKIDEIHFTKKSNIKFKDTFSMAFKRMLEMRKMQKLVFLGFFTSAFLFVISIASLYSAVIVDESEFIRSSKNDYHISFYNNDAALENKNKLYEDIIENELGILYYAQYYFFDYDGFIQGNTNYLGFDTYSNSRGLKNTIKENDVILGSYGGISDVLIDKMILEDFIEQSKYYNLGFNTIESFIGVKLKNDLTISGVVDTGAPIVYLSTEKLLPLYDDIAVSIDLGINLEKGEVNVLTNSYNLNEVIDINGITYKVVGFNDTREYILNQNDYIKQYYLLTENLIEYNYTLLSFDNNKIDSLLDEHSASFTSYYNKYVSDKEWYLEQIVITSVILLITSTVLVVTSLVFLYFIIRGSLISRVYDFGVYRSLGITKKYIYKIFASEVFLISLFSSFVGYIFANVVISGVGRLLSLRLPFIANVAVLIIIFSLNIIIGLIPVRNLLKLSPSEISSKYDI